MDHGQFKVRVGVVHRDAAVFHQQQHKKDHGQEQQLALACQPCPGGLPAKHGGEAEGRFRAVPKAEAQTREHHERKKKYGFREGGECGLAACAHAFKCRACVQRAKHDGKAPHAQQIGCQHKVARKGQWRNRAAEGQQGQRADCACQGYGGGGGKYPCGCAADHLALAQQFGDIIVGLQHGLAVASGKFGLDPVDDAGQQGGQDQGQGKLRKIDRKLGFHECSPHTSRATRVARIYRIYRWILPC